MYKIIRNEQKKVKTAKFKMVDQSVKHPIWDFGSAICRRVVGPTLILLQLTLVLELSTANTSDFTI